MHLGYTRTPTSISRCCASIRCFSSRANSEHVRTLSQKHQATPPQISAAQELALQSHLCRSDRRTRITRMSCLWFLNDILPLNSCPARPGSVTLLVSAMASPTSNSSWQDLEERMEEQDGRSWSLLSPTKAASFESETRWIQLSHDSHCFLYYTFGSQNLWRVKRLSSQSSTAGCILCYTCQGV